jgi:DNA-directed RNA polymerase alpha subunit
MDNKKHLKEVVSMFTDNPILRDYCGITGAEADVCKKVFIENKLYSELAVSRKTNQLRIKEMAFAPFKKAINRIFSQIYETTEVTLNDELESLTVDSIDISERIKKVLRENGITTISKIAELDFNELKLRGNYGVKTIFELQQLAGKLKDSRDILSILRKSGKQ